MTRAPQGPRAQHPRRATRLCRIPSGSRGAQYISCCRLSYTAMLRSQHEGRAAHRQSQRRRARGEYAPTHTCVRARDGVCARAQRSLCARARRCLCRRPCVRALWQGRTRGAPLPPRSAVLTSRTHPSPTSGCAGPARLSTAIVPHGVGVRGLAHEFGDFRPMPARARRPLQTAMSARVRTASGGRRRVATLEALLPHLHGQSGSRPD